MTRPGPRSSRIHALVAEQAARRGGRVDIGDVCAAAVAALPVGGAGLSAMSGIAPSHPLYSTDAISEQLEELQLLLGEGPCVDAFTRQLAVLTPDLRTGEPRDDWPVFAQAALEAGACALFAFPLQIGSISPGVLDLYSSVPVELGPEQTADAMTFADIATLVLLGGRSRRRDTPDNGTGASSGTGSGTGTGTAEDFPLPYPSGYRAEIDQATGMIAAQLGAGMEEAFVRLRAYAYARGQRLADVAGEVLAGRLRFSPGPDSGPGAGPDSRPGSGPDARPGAGPGPDPGPDTRPYPDDA